MRRRHLAMIPYCEVSSDSLGALAWEAARILNWLTAADKSGVFGKADDERHSAAIGERT